MLISSTEAPPELRAQVCIVGGGAAGISLARQLGRAGRSVLLLEGGGLAYSQVSQSLYDGEAEGAVLDEHENYMISSRQRYFGGSSNHWNGWCRPLDAVDFAERPWVPHSGWPIDRAVLDPYYDRAAKLVRISPFGYAPSERIRSESDFLLPPDSGVVTSFFHISRPTRFGHDYREDLTASERVTVVLDANVVHIGTGEDGRNVDRVEFVSLDERRHTVSADAYVLSAGGIENTRLLLAASDIPDGLGNRGGQLGLMFTDHPMVNLGYLVVPGRRLRLRNLEPQPHRRPPHQVIAVLRLSDATQEAHELLNGIFVLRTARPRAASDLSGAVKDVAADVALLGPDTPDEVDPQSTYFGNVRFASEHAPSPESRITLLPARDRYGMRKLDLDWKVGETEVRSVKRSSELLARALGRHLRGRMLLRLDPEDPWGHAHSSNHHMGSTRMHSDPLRGVVDPDCRVHGLDNLYVAGSSVFPTSGASNPTLTLLALTLRLGDHLLTKLTP